MEVSARPLLAALSVMAIGVGATIAVRLIDQSPTGTAPVPAHLTPTGNDTATPIHAVIVPAAPNGQHRPPEPQSRLDQRRAEHAGRPALPHWTGPLPSGPLPSGPLSSGPSEPASTADTGSAPAPHPWSELDDRDTDTARAPHPEPEESEPGKKSEADDAGQRDGRPRDRPTHTSSRHTPDDQSERSDLPPAGNATRQERVAGDLCEYYGYPRDTCQQAVRNTNQRPSASDFGPSWPTWPPAGG